MRVTQQQRTNQREHICRRRKRALQIADRTKRCIPPSTESVFVSVLILVRNKQHKQTKMK